MTIAEAITLLEEAKAVVGPEVPVISMTEVDGKFCIDGERTLELIGLECDDGHEHPFMALMAPIDESRLVPVEGGKLRLIKGGADAVLDS